MKATADTRWRTDEDGTLLMPAKQSEYLDWLLSDIKSPPSQARWCLENDVHERTVQGWKRDPRFVAEWNSRLEDKNLSPERIQDMVDTLYNAGKGGDVKAATTYLDYVQKFMPAPERRTNDTSITGMSDEELDAELRRLAGEDS